jgi:hypothetical protein
MSHTPGPWFAHDFSGVNGEKVTPCDFAVSCTTPDHLTVAVMGMGLTGTPEEWEANVKLIAAAPDLLEALEEVLGWETLCPIEVYEQAREAIAKAKGES